jgi:integrase
MSCPEAPCVCVYAGVCPVTKRRHDLVEIISAGPRAEKNALAARDRLVNQVEERRNPRTNATVDQLPDRRLDRFDGFDGFTPSDACYKGLG